MKKCYVVISVDDYGYGNVSTIIDSVHLELKKAEARVEERDLLENIRFQEDGYAGCETKNLIITTDLNE